MRDTLIYTIKFQQKYLDFPQSLLPRISCMTALCNFSFKGCTHKISYQLHGACMYKTLFCEQFHQIIYSYLQIFISGVLLQSDSSVWQYKILLLQPSEKEKT